MLEVFADMGERSWHRFMLDLETQRTCLADPCIGPHTSEFIDSLAAHTRNQNRLAATTLATPVVGTLPLVFGLFQDKRLDDRHAAQILSPPATPLNTIVERADLHDQVYGQLKKLPNVSDLSPKARLSLRLEGPTLTLSRPSPG